MTIRKATLDDIESLVEIGEHMHAESPRFSKLSYSAQKVRDMFARLIPSDAALVLVAEEDDGEIYGGFAGFVAPHWFSEDFMATDLALFVRLDRRGGIAAARLAKAYLCWAEEKGAKLKQLGISTGVRVEQTAQLYRSLGLKQFGYLFEV